MKKFDLDNCINEIRQFGFTELTGLIPDNVVARICKSIERPFSTTHTNGRRGYIKMGDQHFLANTLTWGRDIIDVYTNPQIIELGEKYSGEAIHLANYRIYKTLPSKDFSMWWHVDNKIDKYNYSSGIFDVEVVTADKGLIVIMYLVDVKDGGVQLVKGSHKWSRKFINKQSYDDMENDFKDEIVTFNNKPKGTLIAYDYATIHRAQPYIGNNVRMSLFGQYQPSYMPVGEPVLLHARDLLDLTEKQKQILNFGKESTTENWPIAPPHEALDEEDINKILRNAPIKQLTKYSIGKLSDKIIPKNILHRIKRKMNLLKE